MDESYNKFNAIDEEEMSDFLDVVLSCQDDDTKAAFEAGMLQD